MLLNSSPGNIGSSDVPCPRVQALPSPHSPSIILPALCLEISWSTWNPCRTANIQYGRSWVPEPPLRVQSGRASNQQHFLTTKIRNKFALWKKLVLFALTIACHKMQKLFSCIPQTSNIWRIYEQKINENLKKILLPGNVYWGGSGGAAGNALNTS